MVTCVNVCDNPVGPWLNKAKMIWNTWKKLELSERAKFIVSFDYCQYMITGMCVITQVNVL